MAANPQAKRWCFTLNNPTISELELVEALDEHGVEYLVFQLEEGENQTPHYQGFVCFFEKKRLSQIRHVIPANFLVARGSVAQNKKYCTKEEGRIGQFCEIGTPPEEMGARTDLIALHSALKAGLTTKEFSNEYFHLFIKYPKLVENYELAQIEPRGDGCQVHVTLLVGLGRAGKSTYAVKLANNLGLGRVYRHSLGQWWDGYRGERVVIFDDFRGHSLSLTQFKLVFDGFSLRVPVKGASCNLAATHFFITTNVDPLEWWRDEIAAREKSAITGRFHRILYFENKYEFIEFPDYDSYASLILTPLPDGIFRPQLPPPTQIVQD
uniref:Replication-associated protein n=1 Tax=Cressdnaviricota sp. TaxID=2748378 RepID=A0A6M9Z7S7_9VIRU|nr:MAG: replication-associated protein [Cressdnaviricota sp.]